MATKAATADEVPSVCLDWRILGIMAFTDFSARHP